MGFARFFVLVVATVSLCSLAASAVAPQTTPERDPIFVGSWICKNQTGLTVIIRPDGTGTWKDVRPGQPGTWEGTWVSGPGGFTITPVDSARFGSGGVPFRLIEGKLRDPWGNEYEKGASGTESSAQPNRDPIFVGSWICRNQKGLTVIIRPDGTGTWKDVRPGQPGTWEGTWVSGPGGFTITPVDTARFGSVGVPFRLINGRLRDPWENEYAK